MREMPGACGKGYRLPRTTAVRRVVEPGLRNDVVTRIRLAGADPNVGVVVGLSAMAPTLLR